MVKKSDPAQMQGGNRRDLARVPGNVGTCDLTDVLGPIRVARATGGVPVSVCNLDLDLWILGYRYGYVSMTHCTDPGGTVSMTPYVRIWGYIPAGLRPSLHTGTNSVK